MLVGSPLDDHQLFRTPRRRHRPAEADDQGETMCGDPSEVPANPMVWLTLALADYAVRGLTPVILEQIAEEIESCGHPVLPGAGPPGWQSLEGIAQSFRRVAGQLNASAPLATRADADWAYRILDHVATGTTWVHWPDGTDPGGQIQAQIAHAMRSASNAERVITIAGTDPREWLDLHGTPQDCAIAEQLALAVQDVRRCCAVVRAAGACSADLDALLDPEPTQPDAIDPLTGSHVVVEVADRPRRIRVPQRRRFLRNAVLRTHATLDHADTVAQQLAKASPHKAFWVLSFRREMAYNDRTSG